MIPRSFALALVLAVLGVSCKAAAPALSTAGSATRSAGPTSAADRTARLAVQSFLDGFTDPSGRVVRRDQGDDTVSEGQAYAMLLSVAVGDADAFGRAWEWARAHLQRPDGLLSWHWVNGRVADPQPAADADVIAAWALTLASQRFNIPAYGGAAKKIARSVLAQETVAYGGARILVAGPWARASDPVRVDPSYFTPPAFAAVHDFGPLADAAERALRVLTARAPHLPPDWATLSGGSLQASRAPDGTSPRYGYDAVRVPLWTAASCRASDRAIAASMWSFLKDSHGRVYALDGRPLDPTPSPEALVAAAAAARAAGDARDVPSLLDKAQQLNDAHPRYYAAALVALGRVLLTTDLLDVSNCTA